MTAPQRLTDRKREAIVAAAIAEFRANGFEVTSMDKIAATAGAASAHNHRTPYSAAAVADAFSDRGSIAWTFI